MTPDTNRIQPTVPERRPTMRRTLISLIALAAGTLGACNLDITNPNSPSQSGALASPRAAAIREVVGVFATYRDNRADQIRSFGSFGRETYYMFITDGRWITGPFRDWHQNNAFDAGTQWAGRYTNYRNAYAAIQTINAAPTSATGTATTFTAAEKAGALGVLKTFIALDMLHVVEARGAIGAVVDMTDDVNAVHPIVSEDSVYKWITAKLDAAKEDLDAGGTSFFFPMHSGFSGFGVTANTPAGFGQFNRALKARVEAKRGSLGCGAPCYTAALTALGGTWVADLTVTNRDNGVYVIYSTASGDLLNTASFAVNRDLYVHPLIDSIAGVAADDRYRRKAALNNPACTTAYDPRTEVGVTGTNQPCTYASNVAPIPIIRNEELVLLRAEARWFTVDQAGALTDLAAVRANSGATNGGTAAVRFAVPTTNAPFEEYVRLQRTLSLFQEGHRWVDYRRFNKLAELGTLGQDVTAGFTVATYSVMPTQECDSRNRAGNPGGIPRSCPGGAP